MRRMLVAYDGTEPARRALDVAIELAQALDAEIAVISVVPTHRRWPSTDPCDDAEIHGLALREAQEVARSSGLEPTLLARISEPAETIEAVASEGRYDLVVIGSRGPADPAGEYLGDSVSAHVAAHAPMTVVIAR